MNELCYHLDPVWKNIGICSFSFRFRLFHFPLFPLSSLLPLLNNLLCGARCVRKLKNNFFTEPGMWTLDVNNNIEHEKRKPGKDPCHFHVTVWETMARLDRILEMGLGSNPVSSSGNKSHCICLSPQWHWHRDDWRLSQHCLKTMGFLWKYLGIQISGWRSNLWGGAEGQEGVRWMFYGPASFLQRS